VVLQATSPFEAIRLRPARLYVIRAGTVIARTAPVIAELDLNGEHHTVDFTLVHG
jgi:cytosine deaminase